MQRTWQGEACSDLQQGCAQEWLLPNGVGGYASQSLLGVSTRAEHSLLMATTPEGQRRSLLARLEDTFDKRSLATHQYPNAFWPSAYASLCYISLDPSPVWVFDLGSHLISRRIEVAPGRAATRVTYHLLKGSPATLQLKPLFAFRAQQALRHKQDGVEYSFAHLRKTLTVLPEGEPLPCVLHLGDAAFHAAPDWFFRFVYERDREAERPHEEDLFTPGVIEVELSQEQPFSLWAIADLSPPPLTDAPPAPSLAAAAPQAPSFSGPLLFARQIARRRALIQLRELLRGSAPAFFSVDHEKNLTLLDALHTPTPALAPRLLSLPGLCLGAERVADGLSLLARYTKALPAEITTHEALRELLLCVWATSVLAPQDAPPGLVEALQLHLSPLLSRWSLIPLYEEERDAPLGLAGLWYWALCWSAQQALGEVRAFDVRASEVFSRRSRYGQTSGTLEADALWAAATPQALFSGQEARPLLDKIRALLLTPRGLRRHEGDATSAPQFLGLYTGAYLNAYGDNNSAARDHVEQALLSLLPHLERERCIGFVSETFAAEDPYQPSGAVASAPNLAEPLRALSLLGINE